ncbi:Conserved_hypothetical protein [Hexamita inflata]|uniref:Uncharacterized protein n=1 Tax=Hexamita inflata TaxID=28002 RepID=A0AA86TS68_9EUKA|nr:Conserved hypothetical protein [Hexamita inflata]
MGCGNAPAQIVQADIKKEDTEIKYMSSQKTDVQQPVLEQKDPTPTALPSQDLSKPVIDQSIDLKPRPKALPPLKAATALPSLNFEVKTDQHNKDQRITEHLMINELELKMHGGSEMNFSQSSFISPAQVQIQAPNGTKIKITAKSKGQVQLVACKPSVFPLVQMTDIVGSSGIQLQTCELIVTSAGIEGFVLLVASSGQMVDLKVDGMGKPILSLTHIDPLP